MTQVQLAAHVAKVLEHKPRQCAVAYAWPQVWTGATSIEVAGQSLPLHYCESPLALREALDGGGAAVQVLLVNMSENRLGADALARMVHHRLLHVDRWQLVCDAIGVKQVDPRLSALPWMAEKLLDALPTGYANTSPVLTLEQAIALYLQHIFALALESSSLEDLALACERHGALWMQMDPPQREVLGGYLVARFGPLANAFTALMAKGNHHATIAAGLVCDVLYAERGRKEPALRDARVRLESRLGGYQPSDKQGRQWAAVARTMLPQRSKVERHHDEQLATDLLDACGALNYVHLSGALVAGLDAKLELLGKTIERFLRTPASLAQVEVAATEVHKHLCPPPDHPGPDAARMALRLCRSLVVSTDTADGGTVAAYRSHGVWQDQARRNLRELRPAGFATAVGKLLDQVAVQRHGADLAFATRLADRARLDQTPGDSVPIESALDRLIVPLANHQPMLMVVLDGMSMDVAYTIHASLAARGWQCWNRPSQPPPTLLATVPSVTECSRASLLAGRLAKGAASKEKQWFASHEGLRKVSHDGAPPRLFHKAGVEAGHQLSAELADALANPRQRVVGVVINAIDDALAKSEQVRIHWNLQAIPLLDALLERASASDRVVVLTSDHGHVLDRNTKLTPDGAGERYRLPGRAPDEGELLVSGSRVHALMGSDLVEPWREDLRYAPRKNGYHGGISRQEMLVPFSIWTARGTPLPDGTYEPYTHLPPDWWSDAATSGAAVLVPYQRKDAKPTAVTAASGDLFAAKEATSDSVVDALLSSSQLARQNQRIGRMALPADRLAALLRQLEQGSGRATVEQLAQAANMRSIRMRGVISMLERTLNVDGFPVITFEHDTGTVLLDGSLLRTQFQL